VWVSRWFYLVANSWNAAVTFVRQNNRTSFASKAKIRKTSSPTILRTHTFVVPAELGERQKGLQLEAGCQEVVACLDLWLFLPKVTPLHKLPQWVGISSLAACLANILQHAVNLRDQYEHFKDKDDATLQLDVNSKALLCEQYFESYISLKKVTSKDPPKGLPNQNIITDMSKQVVDYAEAGHREFVVVASACVLSVALGKLQHTTHELQQVAGGASNGEVWDCKYVVPCDDDGKGILTFFKSTLDKANLQQISSLRNAAQKAPE
jgi:hypothetical protein